MPTYEFDIPITSTRSGTIWYRGSLNGVIDLNTDPNPYWGQRIRNGRAVGFMGTFISFDTSQLGTDGFTTDDIVSVNLTFEVDSIVYPIGGSMDLWIQMGPDWMDDPIAFAEWADGMAQEPNYFGDFSSSDPLDVDIEAVNFPEVSVNGRTDFMLWGEASVGTNGLHTVYMDHTKQGYATLTIVVSSGVRQNVVYNFGG